MRRYLETSGAADETTVQLLCREHVTPLSVDGSVFALPEGERE